jgi:hypothetical protein
MYYNEAVCVHSVRVCSPYNPSSNSVLFHCRFPLFVAFPAPVVSLFLKENGQMMVKNRCLHIFHM